MRITNSWEDKIFSLLLDDHENGGNGLHKSDIIQHLGMNENANFSHYMKAVREKARRIGLFVPNAVPGNNFRYKMTDNGADAIDSMSHAVRVAGGLFENVIDHHHFVESRETDIDMGRDGVVYEVSSGMATILKGVQQVLSPSNDKLADHMKARRAAINEEKQMALADME